MNAIKASAAIAGTCYTDMSGKYLGRYLGEVDGPDRERGLGPVPLYVFQNGTLTDSWPAPEVIPTSCKNGGKRKGTRKSRRNKRRNNRRNNTRRI